MWFYIFYGAALFSALLMVGFLTAFHITEKEKYDKIWRSSGTAMVVMIFAGLIAEYFGV